MPTEPVVLNGTPDEVLTYETVTDYGRSYLCKGDCVEAMQNLLDAGCEGGVSAIICDPPYGIAFGSEAWDAKDNTAFSAEVWSLALRLLAPGGHLVAFSSPRTYHHLAVAIEKAGFEIRDQLLWVTASGTPVNQDVGKFIDKALGAKREMMRIERKRTGNLKARGKSRPWIERAREVGYHETANKVPVTPEAVKWDGWGDHLSPAHEPMVLARKAFKTSMAKNVLAFGHGPINVKGCDPGSGRFPTNVIHDGDVGVFHDAGGRPTGQYFSQADWTPDDADIVQFFYSQKATKEERLKSRHLTVKPLSLMRWLVRLLCPPGGVVLDPFAGTGTTLEAALLEDRFSIGCEFTPTYWNAIDRRVARAQGWPLPPLQREDGDEMEEAA